MFYFLLMPNSSEQEGENTGIRFMSLEVVHYNMNRLWTVSLIQRTY